MLGRLCVVLALVAVACSECAPAVSEKTDTAAGTSTTLGGDAKLGAQVYKENCAACHGPTGTEGGIIGPSLRNVHQRMNFATTDDWIKNPQPPMPKLYPHPLGDEQVRNVTAYVQRL